jgi:signal transduction histidine kinase
VLAAAVAHEVQQPLCAIAANASACRHWLAGPRPDLGQVYEALDEILTEARRASCIVHRLRRLFHGQWVEPVPLLINDAVRAAVLSSRDHFARCGAVAETALAADLPLIGGDPMQIQQMLCNLLRNAADAVAAVKDRERRVVVCTRRRGGGVQVSVRDTGPGVDLLDRERIFQPFYTTKPEGMGIGLALSRSIAEGHGGRLWVTPNRPHGAAFHLFLPLV